MRTRALLLATVFASCLAAQVTYQRLQNAAKESGKTEEQKAAAVLDFCAPEQLWPDFIIVEIYYYAGKVPFNELALEDQKALFAYAMEYVSKRE